MSPNRALFIDADYDEVNLVVSDYSIPTKEDKKGETSENVGGESRPTLSPLSENVSANSLNGYIAPETVVHEVQVTSANALRALNCVAQNYAWGRVGSSSMVARMKAAQEGGLFLIDESAPYAELWLGTHPSGMSTVKVESMDGYAKVDLLDYVKSDPALHSGKDDCHDLTFLFKVLSIDKVLSIQSHPDKKLAEQLHAARPDVYKDGNHKPEMAIALSDKVRAMCGFLPIQDIADNLKNFPEFASLVGKDITEEVFQLVDSPATKLVLQKLFKIYLNASEGDVDAQLRLLLERLGSLDASRITETQRLILMLADQFPGDSGIFSPLFFNQLTISRGEAFFIGPNEPHAYISGELLECMACSDNVVRAGLTPKLKDVDTLVSMLTYNSCVPHTTSGTILDECTVLYNPPVPDFVIEIITVPGNCTYEILDVQSQSIFLTLAGSARLVQGDVTCMPVIFGSACFASANTRVTVDAGPEGVTLTRAMTNVHHNCLRLQGLS